MEIGGDEGGSSVTAKPGGSWWRVVLDVLKLTWPALFLGVILGWTYARYAWWGKTPQHVNITLQGVVIAAVVWVFGAAFLHQAARRAQRKPPPPIPPG